SRSDINHLLDDIEDRNGAATADNVLALVRKIMNWHAIRTSDFRTPIVAGMSRSEKKEREHVLSDEELRAVWTAAEAYPGPWGQFIRFLLLTGARRDEAAEAPWAEISGDLWVIPASRYKTKTEVTLPLSSAARKVLAELPRFPGGEFVFTATGRRPISGFSASKLRFDIACGVMDWRLHDLRRTARSLLSRVTTPDIAERCLGHRIGGVRGTYDRHRYLEEMRIAFEALAALIARVVHPSSEENVVQITSREESSKIPA